MQKVYTNAELIGIVIKRVQETIEYHEPNCPTDDKRWDAERINMACQMFIVGIGWSFTEGAE